MAGLFINTLPLYLRLPPAERVSDLLVRLQDQQSRLIAHQHLGLAEIQRMAGHGELFDTLLVFENYPVDPADQRAIATPDGELQITGAGGTGDISHYALGFLALPGPELHIKFAYRPDLFDRGTVEVISRRLVRLLEAFVADPTQPIGQIDLLDPAERKQILLEWNSPAPTSAAEFKPVTTRISEQALNAPDRVAISCEGVSITYGDLEAKTNQVAQHLTALKVKRDERVGLCVGRSLLLPIGLLGVLKAGGAFVPLDATSPKERLLDMAADAGIRHLIVDPTNPSHPDLEAAGYNLIHIADLDESTDSVGEPLKPDQLAYVIYTSGSTGRPKGVALSHRALIQHIDDFIPAFNYTSADRVVQFSPMTFDAAIEQLLPVLTVGGQVIMRGDDVWDLETFSRRLSEERATVADIPITFWRQWMRTLSNEPTSLRRVTTGGEAVPGEGVREWRNGPLGSVRLDNRYGPTETAMSVLYHTTTAEDEATSIVPIGRPYPGRTAYLMDEDCNLVPVGAVGELCIGGDSVARGYLNRPALTAEQFVPDPYGTPGKRLYRTGDLCRQRPDGLVEFIGRSDDQVKIRGYRIEPGEIEALLARDPDVANAKVIVREDRPGQKQLVAYVVPRPEATVDPVALRRTLSEALPDYMVPSAIVVLEKLPLTPNGKVDRRALPAPEFVPENIRPPRTPQEEILAGLFAEVLGLARVGIDDSFFDLGGDSIGSIQLVSRARKAGLIITPRDVFQHRTVEALAGIALPVEDRGAVVADVPVGSVPLTPIIRHFLEGDGPIDRFNQSQLLQVPAGLKEEHLIRALQAILDLHDALRLQMKRAEAQESWHAEIPPAGSIRAEECVRRIDLGRLQTGSAAFEELLAQEVVAAESRLDPERGVLLQAVWFDAGKKRSGRLLIVIHHLAVDGVSWRILVPDLLAAWQAASTGHDPKLDPCGTSFRRWAQQLTTEATTSGRTAELPFWTEIAGTADPLLSAHPLDPRQDINQTAQVLSLTLPATLTAPLLGSVPARFHGRINDVLLTCFGLAIADWRRKHRQSNERTVLLELEGHGREEVFNGTDLSRTVGWFTSLFPVRLDFGPIDPGDAIKGGASLGQAVKRIKEQLRSVPDNGIGYGLLRYLNNETAGRLAASTPAQIAFNYLGRFAAPEAQDWGPAPEAYSNAGDATRPLSHSIALNAVTHDRPQGPELVAYWSWAGRLFSRQEIEDLAKTWFSCLEQLVKHAADEHAGGLTPSDVPLVALTQDKIEELEARIRTRRLDPRSQAFRTVETE
ncbi:amino acid adenylation domain-containing protein/non-ribosomal peptide synthase protein (TIGR01720 family) [Bradyrhizobium sp. USDA 4538]|uniref:amino acid adenylation domain-containing protein n=1 Tax=unclassified Bradyrhizobium TaxID=2631580 RepID=UPI00209DB3E5|nr:MULTISPECIES: amino acid adenylation domain-containing protein [unclassified Bradyrhizobium]MCP1845861.1 amino acid adenylation domain-containing protein/non-ribosomal peptide synthase protein (TIGR01720 family) [Bradyrhizobium sp. USDA 4538]MCP1907505.1 amino acid adenylation domain-containing protein/non-ribosomal peptide synthase protein (TIGR01720 family) [Bradyrhizobium sp. USDA 4537]MCP1985291.1 amino acid adenylation domain-containing protein/non-ribosomal peptide synthase protein (TIG